jgi:hypothetical protein
MSGLTKSDLLTARSRNDVMGHIQTLPLGHSPAAQALVDARAKGRVGKRVDFFVKVRSNGLGS